MSAAWCCLRFLHREPQACGQYLVNWGKHAEGPPLACVDFMHMKSDGSTADGPMDAWATTLVASDEKNSMCLGGPSVLNRRATNTRTPFFCR